MSRHHCPWPAGLGFALLLLIVGCAAACSDDASGDSSDARTDIAGDAPLDLNVGSLLSEVFAYEMLYRCELAELLETEGTITYTDPDGPKTDFLASIDARMIGVSVVRAHPLDNPFTVTRARELLEDKLQGVINSTANVTGEGVWERQILHVIASDEARVTALEEAYELISGSLLIDTIIVVTRTDGLDDPLYCGDEPCGG